MTIYTLRLWIFNMP